MVELLWIGVAVAVMGMLRTLTLMWRTLQDELQRLREEEILSRLEEELDHPTW